MEVESRGIIKMSDLALGDYVRVAGNVFEPVYSFGHKNNLQMGEFLAIKAEGDLKLEVSKDHMVAVEGGRIIPSSMIQIGDKLLTASGDLASVKTIKTVTHRGTYAPFTESGSIVVNGVVASNYISFQSPEYFHIAGIETPINYRWMAHTFNSVHRIAYKVGFSYRKTYTEDGTSKWVAGPCDAGLWLLDQHPIITGFGLLCSLLIFGFAFFVESVAGSSAMALATITVGAFTLVCARRFASLKMAKMV